MNNIDEIRDFIEENRLFDLINIPDGLILIFTNKGSILSGLLELILFLEERFNIAFYEDEIDFNNFNTLEKIDKQVKSKLSNTHN